MNFSSIQHEIIGVCQAFFLLFGARWGYAYYSGKIQFAGETEEKRKIKVKKYGLIIVFGIIGCLVSGAVLLAISLFRLAEAFFL